MRRTVKLGVAVSALIALPVGALAIPAGASATGKSDPAAECAIERLELPAGVKDADVVMGDPTGHYIVGENRNPLTYVLWVDGVPEKLPAPSSGNWYLNDINESGVIVGNAWHDDAWHAFRYADGEYSWLPSPDGLRHTDALGVNKHGDIVGIAYTWPSPLEKTPVYWPADELDTVRVLNGPGPEKADVTAFDISDSGAVLGDWWGKPSGAGTYRWPDVDSDPEPLLGSDGKDHANPRSVAGNLAFGVDSDYESGVVWDMETGEVSATYKKFLDAANADGDVSFEGNWPAIVVRSDSGFVKLANLGGDRPSNARVLFDRDSELVAAGEARDAQKNWQPVVWRGC